MLFVAKKDTGAYAVYEILNAANLTSVRDCTQERKKPGGGACRVCESTEHMAKDCPTREKRTCRNCGSEDVSSPGTILIREALTLLSTSARNVINHATLQLFSAATVMRWVTPAVIVLLPRIGLVSPAAFATKRVTVPSAVHKPAKPPQLSKTPDLVMLASMQATLLLCRATTSGKRVGMASAVQLRSRLPALGRLQVHRR